MKKKIYILLTAALTALAGCIHDKQWEMPAADADDGSVTLNIALPAPVVQDMGRTRVVRDFDKLENINILIAEGAEVDEASEILYPLYLAFDALGNATTTPPTGIVYGKRAADYDAIKSDNDPNSYGPSYGVHFVKEWFQNYGMDPEKVTFIVVGNYGSQINVATVGDLRNLKYNASISGAPAGSPGYNVMYGESELYGGDSYTHPDEDQDGRTLKVELKRLAAMITVKINGSGLSDGVVITPHRISLHNVPSWSYLAKPNNIYEETTDTDWVENGEKINADVQVGSSVGNFTGPTAFGHTVKPIFGSHYTDVVGGFSHSGITDLPTLFMFENIHGANFGETEGVDTTTGYGKRPDGVDNDEEAIFEAAKTKRCSYLEVEAEYLQFDGNGNVSKGGTIVYRVFLGGNIAENFDVVRNTYYRYTLMLSGSGIGEGDASWRLDTDLSETSLLDESDFILNGAGEMIVIDELIANPNQSWYQVDYDGQTHRDVNDGTAYVYVMASSNNSNIGSWIALPLDADQQLSGPDRMNAVTESSHIQYRLYVDPMTENDGVGDNKGYMRRLKLNFHIQNNSYISDWITITQYAPIRIVVDPTDERITPEIKTQIAAAGINPEQPFTIYFDRVDRPTMPWGFDGTSIMANAGSGYDNEILWLNTAAAANYLPFGDGSAMMHAAFINYYQWNTPSGFTTTTELGPTPSIENIIEAAEGTTNPIVPNSIPSREEWKLLEMLDEAGFGVLDSRHDIVPWQPYWTSDAVVGSATQSWAYRRNANSTDSFMQIDRTSPIPYRMIYIAQ